MTTSAKTMKCEHCNRALNRSQWTRDGTMKSCPRCSMNDGEWHIFLSLDEFGRSKARVSPKAPTGIQASCWVHRDLKRAREEREGVLCFEVEIRPQ